MALTSWKEFPFFSVSKVPVPADEDGTYVFDVSSPAVDLLTVTDAMRRTKSAV